MGLAYLITSLIVKHSSKVNEEISNDELKKYNIEPTQEFLTEEDILRLKEGITVYGKENLTSTIEDYE